MLLFNNILKNIKYTSRYVSSNTITNTITNTDTNSITSNAINNINNNTIINNNNNNKDLYRSPIAIYISNNPNPFFNLAYEEYLFNTFPNHHIFFYWRNEPSIIIGRFQNPWKECDLKKVEELKVHLVRRRSGGGAVYQDLGNSIFTFLSPKNEFSIANNNKILLDGLKNKFGINAALSGRNDIEIDGFKVSGAAFQHKALNSLHHGTFLVNLDTTALTKLLTVNPLKLAAKGVSSVSSRVMNISSKYPDVNHDVLGAAILDSFLAAHNAELDPSFIKASQFGRHAVQSPYTSSNTPSSSTPPRYITPNFVNSTPDDAIFVKAYEELSNSNWRFGKTPPFTHSFEKKFDWAMMEVLFNCDKGKIQSATLYSDCLYPIFLESIQTHLAGVDYNVAGIQSALAKVREHMKSIESPSEAFISDLEKWILEQL